VVPVRITSESPHGGWNAVNTTTGREIRIRSAARLRRPLDASSPPAPEPDEPAPTGAADETPPTPCENELKFLEFPTAMEAVQHPGCWDARHPHRCREPLRCFHLLQ
jgi:hypothetical protein